MASGSSPSGTADRSLASGFKIVRREQSARSREHRGVLAQVIYERDGLEILRTEMESGSAINSGEFGNFSSAHHVIEGAALFRTSRDCANLMPGDSIVFSDEDGYTISNRAPIRTVFLSVLFKPGATQHSTHTAAKETLA